MPRVRMLPTPASSTDLVAKDNIQDGVMESVFALPPPALQSPGKKSASERRTNSIEQSSPPLSPIEKQPGSSLQRKRTLSGSTKMKPEVPSSSAQSVDSSLPPPPTRSRKIIQMKPKQSSHSAAGQLGQSTNKSGASHKEAATGSMTSTKRKQGQPSTTSAAGRKIARKTAHSIIERRRRSKMNEEFGVLKDMIPACAGIDMHKLAILQAGIEYVRYLEGCVAQLKAQNEVPQSRQPTSLGNDMDDEEDDASMDIDGAEPHDRSRFTSASAAISESEHSSPSLTMKAPLTQPEQPPVRFRQSSVATDTTNSTYASPNLRPIQSSSSLSTYSLHNNQLPHLQTRHIPSSGHGTYSVTSPPLSAHTPTQTGVSPAFKAFQFSPDLSRTSAWSSVNGPSAYGKQSPNILPLPQAAMPLSLPSTSTYLGSNEQAGENHAEATATAALLMMTTKDRRASVSMSRNNSKKGMSVQDLLSS